MYRQIALSCMGIVLASAATVQAQSPSPSPSPSSKAPYKLVCASVKTGIPVKTEALECPNGQLDLGRGPIGPDAIRPSTLNPQLRNRFIAARTVARDLGFRISIRSGWRSWSVQQSMYERALSQYGDPKIASRWVLPPDKSMHVWGVAIDVHFASPQARNWFRWNSNRFGLCRIYQNEWWHYEPTISPGAKCAPLKPFAG